MPLALCLVLKGYLLKSNTDDNSIELFKGNEEMIIVDDAPEAEINSDDEIVIVLPENKNNDEFVIDLDELGIDLESLGKEVNIVVQVDRANLDENFEFNDGEIPQLEWCFDNDPYEIVYYKFINIED